MENVNNNMTHLSAFASANMSIVSLPQSVVLCIGIPVRLVCEENNQTPRSMTDLQVSSPAINKGMQLHA